MPFEPKILFPGMLAESAARVARDAAERHPERPDASLTAEMGWNAVLLPEACGGAGGGFTDLASIIESLAVRGVDLPVAARCGIVPAVLNGLPAGEAVHRLLSACAEGTVTIELGGPLDAAEPSPALLARGGSEVWRVSGTTTPFALTEDCTHVLLVCREADGGALLACLPTEGLRDQATRFHTMDDRPVATCLLEDMALPKGSVLALGADAERALQAGWRMAVASSATDTVCSMGAALARTVGYLLERRQFGQPLAQFQALRHEVARLYVSYELARSLLQASLGALDTTDAHAGEEGALDLLGLCAGQDAIAFAESVIQLHGGMGMTREMPAARLATRLMANALQFGDPLAHQHNLDQLRNRMPA